MKDQLSDDALALLRLHAQRDDIPVDDMNREAHRELARAGLMVPMHTFAGGKETRYRFTEKGWEFVNGPSPAESVALHR